MLLTVVLVLVVACGPAAAAPPPAGGGRSLFGGPTWLKNREGQLGRTLDVVRIYTKWGPDGPVIDVAALAPLVKDGARTLLISASIPWAEWRSEATRRNNDGDPSNNVPTPWCATPAKIPGTDTPSGKSWFGAVADGDYDARMTSWLASINDRLGASVNEIYVTLHHEPDRLSDTPEAVKYQTCAGTPAEYRAAWTRMFQLARGTVGTGPDRWAGGSENGRLRFVPIFTTWGFWHTAGLPGSPARSLINLATGLPPATATGDDATLKSARVTPWEPDDQTYDFLAMDVFNYSGSVAGTGMPNGVWVDDPATTVRETDAWRMLPNLLASVKLWNSYWTDEIGTSRPKRMFITEFGSVPDPHRPGRKPAWIADACRWLSDPANDVFVLAAYFDVNQMRLKNWNWAKKSNGSWYATSVGTDDTQSINTLGAMSRSSRFNGGTAPCPSA